MRRSLFVAILLALLLSACGGTEGGADEAAPVEPAGPALIMFYTDG